MDKDDAAGGCLAPETNHPPSLAERSLRRHTPKVGAVCGKAARTVLCGGRAMKRASLPPQGKNWVRLAKNAQTKLMLSLIFDIHNLKSEISCHCLARRPRAQQRTSEWRRRWLPVPTRICMSGTVTGSAPSSTCLRGCRRVTVKQGARVVHKTRTALARLMHARVALGTCERGAHED